MAVDSETYMESQRENRELRARVAELEAQKAELQKDRERLDWLQTTDNGGYSLEIISDMRFNGIEVSYDMSLRQAIDNARE